ncbi:MAG: hypothetical protein KAW14_03285 [Candidatus Aegiribacteria sp.]|nr:hypothetical protein [Candidatus Aegiribacteria sp.]
MNKNKEDNRKSWSEVLLRTGVPFEYELSCYLSQQRFAIDPDFSYSRRFEGYIKEHSVDMHATAYSPWSNPNIISSELHLLVECKRRNTKKHWVFFQEPVNHEYSQITIGHTLQVIDEFANHFLRIDTSDALESYFPSCFKGVQIHIENEKSADSTEYPIRHSIEQLRYAMPILLNRLLTQAIDSVEDRIPIFICPIVVTSCGIQVVDRVLSEEDIFSAESIFDISKQVPAVIVYSDYGPDFNIHFRDNVFKIDNSIHDELNALNKFRSDRGAWPSSLPSNLLLSYCSGERYQLHKYFTQFLVCSSAAFPSIINLIKDIVSRVLRKKTKRSRMPSWKEFHHI